MKYLQSALLLVLCAMLSSCASTSSVMVDHQYQSSPKVAILPLNGRYGQQASDLITQHLASNGIAAVERAQIDSVLKEHGYRNNKAFNQGSLARHGRLLGVKKVMIGTVTTADGPLYSFPHVNITLKVVDVESGKITWIGRYGNSMWTSAISTQGDLQRGANAIVKEFVKVHGTGF